MCRVERKIENRVVCNEHLGCFSCKFSNEIMWTCEKKLSKIFFQVERRMPDNVTALRGQINIRDINDHTPTFASGTFYIGVNENIEMGKEVNAKFLLS